MSSRSNGRAIMLIGLVLAVLVWGGLLGPVSDLAWRGDTFLCDRLSLILEPGKEREDLVFLGIDEEWKAEIDPAVLAQSAELQMLMGGENNQQLDRRVCAKLIDKLAAAGVKAIIFDVLFMGSSGSAEIDEEFADALHRHRDKVVLSMMLMPDGAGSYRPISSVAELPLRSREPGQVPREGYVNLWPDAQDEVVRRAMYSTSLGELQLGEAAPRVWPYESLAAVTARLMGAEVPEGRSPRLRYAISSDEEASYAAAYAPRSLHSVFESEQWEADYAGGSFFKDKVVLISTATLSDGDNHPIPGATIFGGQFHLQALGSWLDGNYWQEAPQWVNMVALLAMATLAVVVGFAFRNPITVLCASLALGGGFLMLCAWISSASGVLFAGTPGLLGLAFVTVCAEIGHLVSGGKSDPKRRSEEAREERAEEIAAAQV